MSTPGAAFAAEQLSFYETIPSYQKVIAREGSRAPPISPRSGPPRRLSAQLKTYLDAGATDVVLSPLDRSGAADRESLWAVAASL